jgi:hypothetical protein
MAEYYGDKYEQLRAATPAIEAAGAIVPPMRPISQHTVDTILRYSGLPLIRGGDADHSTVSDEEAFDQIRIPNKLSTELQEEIDNLGKVYDGPVIVRSSGRGDATGIGVYKSAILKYDQNFRGLDAVNAVVASYFSDGARNYRQRAGLEPGFAAFLQPIVGTRVGVKNNYARMYGEDPDAIHTPFFIAYSGNVRIGTPRNPDGLVRLQAGIGSAVDKQGAAMLKLSQLEGELDEDDPYRGTLFGTMSSLELSSMSHRDHDSQLNYFEPDEHIPDEWHNSHNDYSWPYSPYDEDTGLDGADFARQIRAIHQGLNTPTYLEFAVAPQGPKEKLFVIQAGKIEAEEGSIEAVDETKILIDNVRVEATAVNTKPFGDIVCLSDEDKSELYEFDSTDRAQGGYLLAYSAERSATRNKIDVRKLRNVRALLVLESMSYAHCAPPESHLMGYSDKLGIPLLNIMEQGSDTWHKLNGFTWENMGEGLEHYGRLSLRAGKFQVVADPVNNQALILDHSQTSRPA